MSLKKALNDYQSSLEVVDLTEHTKIDNEPLRARLRITYPPIKNRKDLTKQLFKKSYIIGLIDSQKLPEEGKQFKMYHYKNSGSLDFGWCGFSGAVKNLEKEGNKYFFEDTKEEGRFCLEILNNGN